MNRRRAFAEMALFVAAAAAGVFGLGQAFRGSVMWLAVTGVAAMVLGRQMARVQDTWPRRRPGRTRSRASPGTGRGSSSAVVWHSIVQPGRVVHGPAGPASGPAPPNREPRT